MTCRSVPVAKCILLVCTTIALLMSLITSYLGIGNLLPGKNIGLYEDWNSSIPYSLRGMLTNSTFTPAGWGFNAWIVIYIYQLVVVAHCWTTLCRVAPDSVGQLLCTDPDLAPGGLLFFHFLASVLNLTWVFLADRVDQFPYLLVPQVCIIFSLAVTLAASLASSYYWLEVGKNKLASRQRIYWLVVILVQNGVSLYAGWAVFASFVNLDIALANVTGLTNETASFICLTLLISVAVAYVVIELTTVERVLRFIFTPHAAIIWACSAALVNNFKGWTITDILLLLLICIMGTSYLLKVISACIRSRTNPIFPSKSYSLEKLVKA